MADVHLVRLEVKLMPEISVIVPVYNVEKYLRRSLDSLIAQTFQSIEIICVNDGSTDGSLGILNEYTVKDSRIIVVDKKNGGVSSARNAGLQRCNTPYVMFCDPDDEYRPNTCDVLYKAITEEKSDFARCGVEVVRKESHTCPSIKDEYFVLPVEDGSVQLSDDVVRMIDTSVWNKIFKRNIINNNGINFPVGLVHEDTCFYLKYAMVSSSATILAAKLYLYILRDNGYMSQHGKQVSSSLDYIRIMDDVYGFMLRNGLWESKGALFLKFFACFFNIAYHSMPGGDKNECYNLALPILNKIGEREILTKTDGAYRKAFMSIFRRDYVYFGRRYWGIGPLKLVKVVSKVSRFEVRFLGIPVYLKRYPHAPL